MQASTSAGNAGCLLPEPGLPTLVSTLLDSWTNGVDSMRSDAQAHGLLANEATCCAPKQSWHGRPEPLEVGMLIQHLSMMHLTK